MMVRFTNWNLSFSCCGAGAPKAPLCKGSCQRKLTEGLSQSKVSYSHWLSQIRNILLHNPSGPAGHLPLHKGGFWCVANL